VIQVTNRFEAGDDGGRNFSGEKDRRLQCPNDLQYPQ
jgi:hypothetical protein